MPARVPFDDDGDAAGQVTGGDAAGTAMLFAERDARCGRP